MRYTFKTKPYKHQVRAIRKALRSLAREGWAAFFMPMRSGKTKAVIDTMCILQMKYGVKRVLIVAPLSVLGVWRNQIKIHKPDEFKFHIVLLNYEMVYDRDYYDDGTWEPMKRKSLYKFKPDLIIADESHKIGDPGAVQSRHLYYLQKRFPDCKKIIMTGTPFHRKPHRTYGQFRFANERIFKMPYTRFKEKVAVWGGYGDYKFIRAKNEKWFLKKISRGTFMMKTLPFVPPQHEVVPYELDESLPAYTSMANESIALLSNGSTVEAPIALTRALRLAQLCGGRLRDSEGVMVRVGEEKRREFRGLIDLFVENEVQKFVVGHRFVPEMADSIKECRRVGYKVYLMYGKTPRDIREQRIAAFDETEDKAVFIAQVQTGALGIDLSAASICVFYSLPESLVDYDQFCARIRKWKDKRTLTYYYLTGRGTIEEANLAALRANLDLIDALERDPQLLSYQARG
jgi:superfamily II DNA or RNA helicase